MFGFGKGTCVFCDHRVASKEVLRARDWKDVAVCVGCYESWERAGRKCGACGTVVHGPQEVSAFDKPRPTFGHAACGGMLPVRCRLPNPMKARRRAPLRGPIALILGS